MKTALETIPQDAATLPSETEPADDMMAWQMEKLRERKSAGDQGRFASAEDVKAIVRKFIPHG